MIKVSDIMTRPVTTIRGSATVEQAITRLLDRNIHSLIVDRNHPHDAYGILTHTDIVTKVIAFGLDPRQARVYEIMTKPCIVVNPELRIEYLARLFANTGIHCAPVIQSELLGVVSSTDILRHSQHMQVPQTTALNQELDRLLAIAQATCTKYGNTSKECIQAWAAVDAIQVEVAHQTGKRLEQTSFEAFYSQYPEVLDADDYEVWCSG